MVLFRGIIAGLSCLLITQLTYGFTSIRSTQSGLATHWPLNANLTFRVNTTNQDGLLGGEILAIFSNALNRWKQASENGFSFAYFQGNDLTRYPNALGNDQDSIVFFTSNAAADSDRLNCNILALTQIWFSSSSGEIAHSDMRINDLCFQFSANPSDTKFNNKFYLGDVVTHELGHALGLDHSENLQSTMMYTVFPQMHQPSCDDYAAVRTLYRGFTNNQLSGRVYASNGSPVFGAHINAIHIEKGTVLASTLTDQTGSYTLQSLEPGTYAVMIEPYYPGSATLNSYYQTIDSKVCGGSYFQRTFIKENQQLKLFSFNSNQQTQRAADTVVSCTPLSSLNANLENNLNTAPSLANGMLNQSVASLGVFSASNQDHYYLLKNQSGRIQVRALSYSLYSRSDVSIEILDQYGRKISNNDLSNVFSSSVSGYKNYDSASEIELYSIENIYVHVFQRNVLPIGAYPAGSQIVSNQTYYLVSAYDSVQYNNREKFYAENVRCERADGFSAYAQTGEASVLSAVNKDQSSDDHTRSPFGCASISSNHSDGGSGSTSRMLNLSFLMLALFFTRKILRSDRLPLLP